MVSKSIVIIICISILGLFFAFQVSGQGNGTAEGSYITPVNLSAIAQAVYWQGYFGEVIVGGTGASNAAVAQGGNLTELNLYFISNCSIASLQGEIYATTVGSVQWSSMVAGTTAQVDSYLGLNAGDSESGTNTLSINLNYNVSGNNINAPSAYTFVNSSPFNLFDVGVLNDTSNLVYVTSIQKDQIGFESNTHDFQMIVPVPLGSTPNYYFSAELDIVCAPIDFVVNPADILFSDNSPSPNQDIIITATIHNTENGSYSGLEVALLVDNVTQSTNQISISGNSTNITQFSWTAVFGTHDITIRVDPSDSVVEINESNNNASKQIVVSSPLPPPEDMYMSIYTDGECVGELILITVIDEEDNRVSNADISISFNGSNVEDLSTNSQGEASFVPAGEGVYTILASKTGYYDEQENLNVVVCETCFDEILNQDETDVDCGGTCPTCNDGENCLTDSDCTSGWCYSGECQTSNCSDGLLGPGEEDIDCGGPCPICETCNDSILNQDESDVDCGGVCPACGDGSGCVTDSDCTSGWCLNGTCNTASCTDVLRNQDETDIDCGGVCPACGDGSGCIIDSDCISGWCFNGTCISVSCSDGVRNQDETDIDCGGSCPPCSNGSGCITDSDCTSGWCFNGTCNIATCTDGVRNQDE